jgi:hypothetical protein
MNPRCYAPASSHAGADDTPCPLCARVLRCLHPRRHSDPEPLVYRPVVAIGILHYR